MVVVVVVVGKGGGGGAETMYNSGFWRVAVTYYLSDQTLDRK